ncbi:bifunctional phosphopantothenoylcysteine decarboxylase/phosphopantothenate--cysteine ligase CoaBC [Methylomonas sp. EFPC3]|uniref:bifunctional phosphopantothenoylcysteine decarboxylase/phosphopantothenate--cysteine ligase CoaBC n=1 Tax=Methylomonas sp. EFPC3 TaxID=3021710 RepID=UPI00241666E2|nr:bifunctional phosphopantothenoylcysteine decarboxylase/phosphopantothenate--cysteine ligase CoaBC [Methylomonas sp. EFPC3]WFP48750.1 bifunctional phosphopantothenoylcysteine decarboxylase/phosphopantothenate--cysteine ligase CoaBC [Methylomonas sp. EFPC3]
MGRVINKRILLGVCGGIAAYKAAELLRLLRKQGCEVRVVMTAAAARFVAPLTFQALSGHSVHSELLDPEQEQAMSHIQLARWADLLLIAPATADTLAKMAHGLADDLLSTLYLAAECPVYVAPAMNQAMWGKPVTQENIARLQQHGVTVIGPAAGEQACGEQGYGRMVEPAEIVQSVLIQSTGGLIAGLKLVVSAGPTREPLDPVRFISNRSSGKMGYALTKAAVAAGADVTLVSGPVHLPAPTGAKFIQVETALQMYQAVLNACADADLYIGAAAVADYRAKQVAGRKLKKGEAEDSVIELEKNPDIVAAVAGLLPKPWVVGFAAETDDLENYALGKLRSKNLDMIAANWVGRAEGGFDSERNALQVFWPDGRKTLEMADKTSLAVQLLQLIAERMHEKNPIKNP